MIRAVAIGLAVALSVEAGAAQADFAAGRAAYAAGKYRVAWDQWYAAALRDDARAQEGLGRLLESGAGITRNLYAAYVWYQVADFHVDVDLTQKLSELATQMTPADLEWAEQKAYARSIDILYEKNWLQADHLQLTHPTVDRDRQGYGYTWVCDCGSIDPALDGLP
jgi:hypothetical protein